MNMERSLEKAEGCGMGMLLWVGRLWEGPWKVKGLPCRDLEVHPGSYRSRQGAECRPSVQVKDGLA